jgi:hypothetical protein
MTDPTAHPPPSHEDATSEPEGPPPAPTLPFHRPKLDYDKKSMDGDVPTESRGAGD